MTTPIEKIYSEASIGKASLDAMGIRPWREWVIGQMPPELLGIIMSTYYGGRAEVNWRREQVRVLYCDFLSMYPTVCSLMNLWQFVIAEGVAWDDSPQVADDVRAFLQAVMLDDLQKPETWKQFTVLVQVLPDRDRFPVRAEYGDEGQDSIGVNYLSREQPLWYTLADCIASKLDTGKAPTVVKAIRFAPIGMQHGLQSLNIAGNAAYRVDPLADDFYRRLIELRMAVKRQLDTAEAAEDKVLEARLDAEQLVLKIIANATSYGIFVELNVTRYRKLQDVMVYGPSGEGFPKRVHNIEEPGRYFHPMLATLITGSARLMLAIAEHLAKEEGITWALCDTDSLALACPAGMDMDDADFLKRAQRVRTWFDALNPYAAKDEPVFKIEKANYRLVKGKRTKQIEPLYALAVSAKRYALFNIDGKGRPVIRKASGHGLGYLRAPYDAKRAPRTIPRPIVPLEEIGVDRWQYDLWYRTIQAELAGHRDQVNLRRLSGFDLPMASRYAATTPKLLRWFNKYNDGRPYREQVRPFGFLFALQTQSGETVRGPRIIDESTDRLAPKRRKKRNARMRPVAPFDKEIEQAVLDAFDRHSGEPISRDQLETYRAGLAQHHLHPEAKFANAEHADHGQTLRRHIRAVAVRHKGKEADLWEEQAHVGEEDDAQIEYGMSPEDEERLLDAIRQAGKRLGQRALSTTAGVSLSEVSEILRGKRNASPDTFGHLRQAIRELAEMERARGDDELALMAMLSERCEEIGVRRCAAQLGIDAANLRKMIAGTRKPSRRMLTKWKEATLSGPAPGT